MEPIFPLISNRSSVFSQLHFLYATQRIKYLYKTCHSGISYLNNICAVLHYMSRLLSYENNL